MKKKINRMSVIELLLALDKADKECPGSKYEIALRSRAKEVFAIIINN